MPFRDPTQTALIVVENDTYCWKNSATSSIPLKDMNDDYLANVLRLIQRRRHELQDVMLTNREYMTETSNNGVPEPIRILIDEDQYFINIILSEFDRRGEIEEYEDE